MGCKFQHWRRFVSGWVVFIGASIAVLVKKPWSLLLFHNRGKGSVVDLEFIGLTNDNSLQIMLARQAQLLGKRASRAASII